MQTKTSYEEEILREVEGLPKDVQKKVAKFIYLLKRVLKKVASFSIKTLA